MDGYNPFGGIGGLLTLVQLAVGIWAIVDVVRRTEPQFQAAGQNRTLWLVLNIVGLLFCFILPVVYLAVIRPKVESASGV